MHKTLLNSTTWGNLIHAGQRSDWYGVALARILLLLGGGEVRYTTGRFDGDAERYEGDIYVFTDETVITASVGGTDYAWPERFDVESAPRRSLRSIEAETGDSIFGPEVSYAGWPPADVKVTAVYESGRRLDLPLEPGSSETRAALAEFLPSLLADLSAGKR
ncbi:hypothetical protein ICW40_13560 [Actinotalea ferrariae]|uniref:hypothetical protein n=1 Tax=Actinotalea ferrariae TaxID=1386098 RepID=UPI001C8BC860|nr:hypothetical protein [Actinotalea ferrariae]MBX9245830.1 hypothetical protein [Actinotalea ferrariae]